MIPILLKEVLNNEIKLSDSRFSDNQGKWFGNGPKYSGEEVIRSYDWVQQEHIMSHNNVSLCGTFFCDLKLS